MPAYDIPFSVPFRAPAELEYLERVLESGHAHGDGHFTRIAADLLSGIIGAPKVLLTTSGTHALEMASMLLDVGVGDEVILPSFTFASAATAVTQFGGVPVFVDSEPISGNVSPQAIAEAITPKTKAISVVHYGGVGAAMPEILAIAAEHGIPVIEDNAHGLTGTLDGRSLGTWGDVAIQSFHDTKNVHSGEGGALVVNTMSYAERAEIIREKGTNRSRFLRGQVDKYTWVDRGSSYLMSELSAAVLTAQLEHLPQIQNDRLAVWAAYASELSEWASTIGARLMPVLEGQTHPAHLFYIEMPDHDGQTALISHLRAAGIVATFHYVPLDSSPAGQRYGRTPTECSVAADFSSRIVRLPLWPHLGRDRLARVIDTVAAFHPAR